MSQAPSEQAMSQGDKPGRWKGAQTASNEPGSQQETMQVAREPEGAREPIMSQGTSKEPAMGQSFSKVPKRQQ